MKRFFFMGNCQARYAAAAFAGGGDPDLEVYVIGPRFPSNASFSGRAPTYIDRDDALALKAARPDALHVAFLQETPLQKTSRVGPSMDGLFDHSVHFPHLQFRSLWPEAGDAPESERKVRRRWHIEQVSLSTSFARCGLEADQFAAYLRHNAETTFFHTHSHPTGAALGFVWSRVAEQAPGDLRPLVRAAAGLMNESSGIDVNTSHPVSAPLADALGLEWHRSPTYRALIAFGEYLAARSTKLDVDTSAIDALGQARDATVHHFVVGYRALKLSRRRADSLRMLAAGRRRFPESVLLKTRLFREYCAQNKSVEAQALLEESALRPYLSIQDERHLLRTIDTFLEKGFVRRMVERIVAAPDLNGNVRDGLRQRVAVH